MYLSILFYIFFIVMQRMKQEEESVQVSQGESDFASRKPDQIINKSKILVFSM